MLMYLFNQEVFYYIKIIVSCIIGLLAVKGSLIAFYSDKDFLENKNKEGIKKIIIGIILFLLSLLIAYFWMISNKAGYFNYFKDEKFGTPQFLIDKRIIEEKEDKLKLQLKKEKDEERNKLKDNLNKDDS